MKTTQADRLLEALQAGARLTPKSALSDYGCMRLAARVFDLKAKGHKIMAEHVKVPTRDGEAWVTQYWLDKQLEIWP